MSLRYRLLLVLLGAAMVASLTATGATYYWARHEIDELLDYQLRQQALSLEDKAYLLGSIAVVEPDPEQHVLIQLWDRRGVLRYQSHRAVELGRPTTYGYANSHGSGEDWRVYATELGPWIAQVAQPLKLRRQIAANAAIRILLPTLAVLPVLGMLMWWIVGRVLAPLSSLANIIDKRETDALDPLPTAALPRELALMVNALNSLIARLRAVLNRQQDFMADAAHELRTPLTAVSLQLQLLERADSPGEAQESMSELKRGIARSSHLIERLLTLARLDAVTDQNEAGAVDLSAMAARCADTFRPLAVAEGIELSTRIESTVTITGYQAPLQTLLENLLDNALRYTPRHGRVSLMVQPLRHGAQISVQDTGPGILPAERVRVFDRFYRVPGTEAQGSGLGLSIVKRVADLHGARVDITDAVGGGAVVTVTFGQVSQ